MRLIDRGVRGMKCRSVLSTVHWMVLCTVPWTVLWTAADAAQMLPAFPGAEGFGAYTIGGRGGKILPVTNLRDYDPRREEPIAGSLRAACEERGPRTVIFRVSGTIPLERPLSIEEPFLTIAGQSAPGGGICLKNHGTSIRTREVIVRHVRFRPGDEAKAEADALSISPSGNPEQPVRNVIFDHCSASWAIDETLSVSGADVSEVTVQWCIISESLNNSLHHKGPHGYGSLLKTNGDVTFHHNLYASHASRSPRPGTYGEGSILLDFRNNVIYNSFGYSAADPARINYIGNYIRKPRKEHAFSIGGPGTTMFVQGNIMEGAPERNLDNWRLIANVEPVNKMPKAYPVAKVATDDAKTAYERILASCGATLPERDAADARLVAQIRAGTSRIIDSQKDVGGWPQLTSTPPPQDGDHDGMPDAWETKSGLNAADASDSSSDADNDGYTNLEERLNGTDPKQPEA